MPAVPRCPRLRRVAPAVAFALTVAGLSAVSTPSFAASCSGVPGDVNGDGFADVAIAEPGGRGSVHVFYGTAKGLVANASGSARDDQLLVNDGPDAGDDAYGFGSALVVGDLDRDGCADLVVGDRGDQSALVFYGSVRGFARSAARVAAADISTGADVGLQLSDGLVIADLDGDGRPELVIGAAGTNAAGTESAGAFVVVNGRGGRLSDDNAAGRATVITRDTPGIRGTATEGQGFGATLVAGDFDGDQRLELAVGSVDSLGSRSGSVEVIRLGAASQPAPITPASAGLPGRDYDHALFGSSLAVGDVNGDGRDDVVAGDPNNACGGCDIADRVYGQGAVALLLGSAKGLTSIQQYWTQSSPGVGGVGEQDDAFGAAVAIGAVNADRFADLVVGTPGDSIGGVEAGTVTVLAGSAGGLTTGGIGGTRFSQDTAGVPGADEVGDRFGSMLQLAHVQSRVQSTLIVGSPGEAVYDVPFAGAATQFGVSATGPTGTGSRAFHAGSAGVKGPLQRGGEFGAGPAFAY